MNTYRSDGSPLEQGTIVVEQKGRRRTQEEQNKVDDEKRKEAMKELVASWMERLQLISVITTFFASVEATIINITTGEPTKQDGIQQATNAALLGALVMHTSAAIVSFLAAFFLINYRVHEARREEATAEGTTFDDPVNIFEPAVDPGVHHPTDFKAKLKRGPIGRGAAVWSTNPHVVQVGPFHGQPPTNILGRCHSLSVLLATIGFVLAMLGIGCFAWSKHARSASIFTTIWIGICVVLGVGILVVPDVQLTSGATMLRLARVV